MFLPNSPIKTHGTIYHHYYITYVTQEQHTYKLVQFVVGPDTLELPLAPPEFGCGFAPGRLLVELVPLGPLSLC